MRILFIGGTGTISAAISRQVLADPANELYVVNRGSRGDALPPNARHIAADVSDEAALARALEGISFDSVCDFIAFVPEQLERDYRLFAGRTRQFMFISSASAYQKPLSDYRVNEGTPLANPYWEYSRNKIACEDYLWRMYRENGFPITIIRPSHTYDERSVPLGVHGSRGSWQVIRRMLDGKPVIIHGDGTSLWTMTHNSDFARAFVGLLCNRHALGEAVQITSDETLTWNQIYSAIAAALGVELNAYHVSSEFLAAAGDFDFEGGLIGDKANSVVFDNSKLHRLVPGFTAVKRFDQEVARTVEYVLSHEECQQEDPEFDEWCDRVIAALERAKKEIRG